MKTTTLPPIRVTPKIRSAIESVLHEGESLSAFMLEAVSEKAELRRAQKTFIARAKSRARHAARTGISVGSDEVFKRMESVLARARQKQSSR